MSAKRGSSRRGPSLAVLPLALLATLIVLSQRKWNASGAASWLAQPGQDLGAAFAKAAERERGRTDQSAAAAEVAAKVARATVAAKGAAAAEVAAAAEASTTADEAAARAAAVAAPEEEAAAQADAADEAAAAAVGDADETAAATADADGTVAAADQGESAAAKETDDTDETAAAAEAGNAADAAAGAADASWEPAGAEDYLDAAGGAADDPLDGKGAASAPDAAVAAAGEPAAAGKPGLEEEAAALAAALDSSEAETEAAGAAGAADGAALDAEADSQSAEAAEATPAAAAAADAAEAAAAADAAGAAGAVTAAADGGHSEAAAPPDEEAAQQDRSQPAAAAEQQAGQQGGQQPCTPAVQSPAEALDSLLASTHEYFLSEDDVRRGVAFRGSGARAQAVAAKLLAGQPVHVAVVGGSVTWGQGAIYGGNFGVRFFNWINATWPSPHHRFTNAAKPAVTSSLYAICGGSMVPQDADIVVLEFAFNDNFPGISLLSPPRAAYEQLMRRMLNFPNSPLVMSLHFFGYWIAKPKLQGPDPPLFYATGEDDLAVIAQHYDVPVLSVRNAALHHMENGDPGFKVDVMDPHQVEGLNLTEYFYFDDHHPYDLTGHRAMADLLVAVMQDAARHVVQQQEEAAQPAQQQQVEQQQQAQQQQQQQQQADQAGQQAEQQAGLQTGQQQGAGSQAAEKAQQAQQQGLSKAQQAQQPSLNTEQQAQQQAQQPVLPPVPDPMFPGNWESPDPTCRLGASFKDTVVDSEGFEWRPQNPNATEADAQKWAWQGNAPGDWALLRLNTDLGRAAKKAENARVILGHVRSWRELGSARLECVGGCRCPTLRLEHKWKHKSTQTALVALEVSQHPQCEIRVTVAKPAGPDAATILNAVMVDRAGGAGLEMGNVGQWDMMGNVGG